MSQHRIPGPNHFVSKLKKTWRLDNAQCARMLGCSAESIERVLAGSQPIETEKMKERFRTLFEIRKQLWSLFQDERAENEWLREPREDLEGKTPLALLSHGGDDELGTIAAYVWHAGNPGGS